MIFSDLEQHSNSANSILNTVDGLLPLVDDIQNRLQQLNSEHKVKFTYKLFSNNYYFINILDSENNETYYKHCFFSVINKFSVFYNKFDLSLSLALD